MTPRLRIASEQMAALLAADLRQPFDMQSPNKEIAARALDYADALLAEHERTSAPAPLTTPCPREATAERLTSPPSPPAATAPPHEIPDKVARKCCDVWYSTLCDAEEDEMRAALHEYDRQMPALRGRVLDTALCCVSPQGRVIGVYQQRHFAEEAATVCGGTVHRVALVEMVGKP